MSENDFKKTYDGFTKFVLWGTVYSTIHPPKVFSTSREMFARLFPGGALLGAADLGGSPARLAPEIGR